jgi:hypothetical protein
MDAPPPDADHDVLVKTFAPQFEAAENLRAYAWASRPRGRAGGGERYRSLIFAIFARATLTYRAVVHLCRGGYTEQADMLNRSLFEDMAYALWVSLPEHQEEAIDLLAKHTEYSQLLNRDSIEKHKDWLGDVELRDLSHLEANRKEYAALFGNYGEKSWTTKDIYSILGEVEVLWADEERAKRELWGFYSLGHRINNQKLHNTSHSINQAAKVNRFDEEGQPVIRLSASPTEEEGPMIRALYGALFTYGRLTRLLVEETGGKVDEFDAFYDRQLGLLENLSPSRRKEIGRNDPCPCESGKKYKVCHGS